MRCAGRWVVGLAGVMAVVPAAFAAPAAIENLNSTRPENQTSLVVALSDVSSYRMFTLAAPDRVVVDIDLRPAGGLGVAAAVRRRARFVRCGSPIGRTARCAWSSILRPASTRRVSYAVAVPDGNRLDRGSRQGAGRTGGHGSRCRTDTSGPARRQRSREPRGATRRPGRDASSEVATSSSRSTPVMGARTRELMVRAACWRRT